MQYDYLIVGAGFSGCVLAERIASQLNKKVLIVERRSHIGGNSYDYKNEDGLFVHKYGPHWFHTNSKKIFDYLSQFTEWINHEHKVRSYLNGELYPFPINMDTLNKLYGLNLRTIKDTKNYLDSVREKIDHPQNAEEYVLSKVGKDLYEKFFKGYTQKHWGIEPKHLAPSVTARIPVRYNRDDRYFTDKYQGLPKDGYNTLFQTMLTHPNIVVVKETDYRAIIEDIKFNKMIYTGPIDEYFDFLYGELPYRSIKLKHKTVDKNYYQPYQQINFPNGKAYTRIVEVKHASKQIHDKTVISYEYPCEPSEVNDEKFYPIPNMENEKLLKKYKIQANKLRNVIFCGRLADYRYYHMDQTIGRALKIFEKISSNER